MKNNKRVGHKFLTILANGPHLKNILINIDGINMRNCNMYTNKATLEKNQNRLTSIKLD
jgi:hypothetical protein